jgi:hypothetical protein
MRPKVILLLFISFYGVANGQTVVGGNQAKAMDMNTVPYGTISAFGFPEKVIKGSKYLFADWKIGTLEVESGVIKKIPMNIDVQNGLVEVNTDKGVRTVPTKLVKSLKFESDGSFSQSFINAKKYNGEQARIFGIFEVLVDNEITLLKYNYVYAKEGSYNAALDMGDNEVKYIVKSKYFLHEKKGTLLEVPVTKKKFLESFSEADQNKLDAFLKENGLKLKEQDDLLAVCTYLNEQNIVLNLK